MHIGRVGGDPRKGPEKAEAAQPVGTQRQEQQFADTATTSTSESKVQTVHSRTALSRCTDRQAEDGCADIHQEQFLCRLATVFDGLQATASFALRAQEIVWSPSLMTSRMGGCR